MSIYTVNELTTSDLARKAPSVFSTNAHPARSEHYSLLRTCDIVDALREEGFVVTDAGQSGQGNHARHMLRFTHVDNLGKDRSDVTGGGFPQVVLTNSHDGTTRLHINAGYYRLVCANGAVMNVIGNQDAYSSVKHIGHTIEEVVAHTHRVAARAAEIQESISRWTAVNLTDVQRREYARRAVALRFPKVKNPNLDEMIRPRRLEDQGTDLYTLYNVVQENCVRGGVRVGTRTARPIFNITKNRQLNVNLWQQTSEFCEELTESRLLVPHLA